MILTTIRPHINTIHHYTLKGFTQLKLEMELYLESIRLRDMGLDQEEIDAVYDTVFEFLKNEGSENEE